MTINYDFGEHEAEETITFNVDVTTSSGTPVDPATITISIRKPSGSLDLDDSVLVRDDQGDYHYNYTISPEIGKYLGRIKGINASSEVTMRTFEFKGVRSV